MRHSFARVPFMLVSLLIASAPAQAKTWSETFDAIRKEVALPLLPVSSVSENSVRNAKAQTTPASGPSDYFANLLRFPSAATVCSSNNFSRVDACYNAVNPPVPSLQRSVTYPSDTDTTVTAFPGGVAADGRFQALPSSRASNDGRLIVHSSPMGNLSFRVFRPEALKSGLRNGSTPSLSPESGMHPLIFHNPWDTSLPHLSADGLTAPGWMSGTYHFNLCDDSGSAATAAGQISPTGRNPVACRAKNRDSDSWMEGDCYQVTLEANMNDGFLNPAAEGWELRTVDLTVFVDQPKTVRAGEHILVYPRFSRPQGPQSWDLPANELYNFYTLTRIPESAGGPAFSWPEVFTGRPNGSGPVLSARTLCYNPNGSRKAELDAPHWCAFFDAQDRVRGNYEFYNSGPLFPPTLWSGLKCGSSPSPNCDNRTNLFEPSTTADGKVIVMNTMYGIMYSVNTVGACKASGWNKYYPISAIPSDSRLANYPIYKAQRASNGSRKLFRDASGNTIPFGSQVEGAYGWIDREARNLIFTVGNAPRNGFRASGTVNPVPAAGDNPDFTNGKGYGVLGAWTQGKLVIVDNGLNLFDSMSGTTTTDYDLALYSGNNGTYRVRPSRVSSIFSFENHFNFVDALSPTMPFDVVWQVSGNNHRNAEIVFDEYLMNSAFVIAHMNSTVNLQTHAPNDGFVQNGNEWRYTATPVLQNAATSDPFFSSNAVTGPQVLQLKGGARVEPLSQGGVLGKGVYLDGDNDHILMSYPSQPSRQEWYLGIWLDPRTQNPSEVRVLYSFPDGSWIGISRDRIFSVDPNAAAVNREKTVLLPGIIPQQGYYHFGMTIRTAGAGLKELKYFINGTPVIFSGATHLVRAAAFNLMPSRFGSQNFIVGSNSFKVHSTTSAGMRPIEAWVDELRIHSLGSIENSGRWFNEFMCNQALGSLVNVALKSNETLTPHLSDLRQTATRHGVASQFSQPEVAVCEQLALSPQNDSPNDLPPQDDSALYCANRTHRSGHPDAIAASRCLRGQTLDPAGFSHALRAGSPRPDFSGTMFCLSCHAADAKLPSLRLTAITQNTSMDRDVDTRRQPLDWPNTVSGRWPDSYPVRGSNAMRAQCSLNSQPNECTAMDWLFDFRKKMSSASEAPLLCSCPAGVLDNGRCAFAPVPAGAQPFVYNNQFYVIPELRRCPSGNFDGANCYQSQVPANANPFVHQNSYYYEPFADRCPGGHFDGANCHVSTPPANSRPFIYRNQFYTTRVNGACTTGSFDGANCYVGGVPSGANAFIYNGSFYFTPITFNQARAGCSNNGVCCPVGQWDGANCRMGSAPSGTNAFIYNRAYYTTPRLVAASTCGSDPLCCPVGTFDGANCYLPQQPPQSAAAFISQGRFYSDLSCQ
ncbi:MAG: hypothetical protein H7222_01840 [Methylotenera sp.]|nr:hypothetical protein [Oligoflexia bacterium]